jgi:hypothetical protein
MYIASSLHQFLLPHQLLECFLSLKDMRSCFKEYPSTMVYTNGHFQIVITVEILFKQYKILTLTC